MNKVRRSPLHRALKWAHRAHKRQDRDGECPLPYLTHAVDVMNRLRYQAKVTDETILIAGLLHDVIEESDVTLGDLERAFGVPVAALVQELTRREPDPALRETLTEPDWYELRNRLLLEDIAKMSRSAHVVKLADRASNVQGALATRSGLKLERYLAQSRAILGLIDRSVCPDLWDEIADRVSLGAMAHR